MRFNRFLVPGLGIGIAAIWLLADSGSTRATAQVSGDGLVTVSATVVAPSPKNDDAKKKDAKDKENDDGLLVEFMQKKLGASSEILRGLMIEDYELIQENADKLLVMSKAEQWRASNDMMYLQHSKQFRITVEELKRKAGKRSIDGVSLAWVNTTMNCIQCHEWVRNFMVADGNLKLTR